MMMVLVGCMVLHKASLGRLSTSSTHVSQLVTVNDPSLDPSIGLSQLGRHMLGHALSAINNQKK